VPTRNRLTSCTT